MSMRQCHHANHSGRSGRLQFATSSQLMPVYQPPGDANPISQPSASINNRKSPSVKYRLQPLKLKSGSRARCQRKRCASNRLPARSGVACCRGCEGKVPFQEPLPLSACSRRESPHGALPRPALLVVDQKKDRLRPGECPRWRRLREETTNCDGLVLP